MTPFHKTLIALAVTVGLAAPASAATLRLDAEAKFPAQSGDFSIVFDDLDNDGLLSSDEILSFSGFQDIQLDRFYTEVLRIPGIIGISDEPPFVLSSGLVSNRWLFGNGPDQRISFSPTAHTYSIAAAVVPLPASGLLLLAGLGGLMIMRRRATA